MNRIFLDGRLVCDPKRTKRDGMDIAEFRIANNGVKPKGAKKDEKAHVNYVDVVVFAGWAKHLKARKGPLVVIEGRLRHESWEAEDGTKHQRLRVVAETVREFLPGVNEPKETPQAVPVGDPY